MHSNREAYMHNFFCSRILHKDIFSIVNLSRSKQNSYYSAFPLYGNLYRQAYVHYQH